MTVISFDVWNGQGVPSFHSISVGILLVEFTLNWEKNLSQMQIINIKRLTTEMIEPIDDRMFHFVNASG